MLLRKSSIILILLVLLAGIAATSVGAITADVSSKADTNGLIITSGYSKQTPGQILANAVITPMTVSGSIRQGQTNWYSKYISQGCPGYYIDLNWGNSANSLQLRVYAADGRVYGPFYDNADGRIDGRIYLYVSRSGGLPGGTYYHEVYGYRVSGTQSYTI